MSRRSLARAQPTPRRVDGGSGRDSGQPPVGLRHLVRNNGVMHVIRATSCVTNRFEGRRQCRTAHLLLRPHGQGTSVADPLGAVTYVIGTNTAQLERSAAEALRASTELRQP